MRNRWLHWTCTVAVVTAVVVGCASRNSSRDSSGSGSSSALAKREAEEFKAQARQGFVDFVTTQAPIQEGKCFLHHICF